MIQGAANSIGQKTLGFENLLRFAPPKVSEGGRSSKASSAATELTPEQQQQVDRLKQTDLKVRAHEQAHITVGADLVRGGPSFSYTTGPDNKRYAISGEVSIDVSPGRTPEETIPKAQHIRATALAPADPSPQDHSIAAQANQLELWARQELFAQQKDAAATTGTGGGTDFYRGVEDSATDTTRVGGHLDLFA